MIKLERLKIDFGNLENIEKWNLIIFLIQCLN